MVTEERPDAVTDRAAPKSTERPMSKAMAASGCVRIQTLEQARDLADLLSVGCPDANSIAIGLAELMINGIEHGNLGIGFEEKTKLIERGTWLQSVERRLRLPENADKHLTVRYSRDGSTMRISIEDQGRGFDPKPFMHFGDRRWKKGHGIGIAVARVSGFESVEYREPGNLVEVTVRLEAPAEKTGRSPMVSEVKPAKTD